MPSAERALFSEIVGIFQLLYKLRPIQLVAGRVAISDAPRVADLHFLRFGGKREGEFKSKNNTKNNQISDGALIQTSAAEAPLVHANFGIGALE